MSKKKTKLTEKKYDTRPKRDEKAKTWTTKPSKEKRKNVSQTKA